MTRQKTSPKTTLKLFLHLSYKTVNMLKNY